MSIDWNGWTGLEKWLFTLNFIKLWIPILETGDNRKWWPGNGFLEAAALNSIQIFSHSDSQNFPEDWKPKWPWNRDTNWLGVKWVCLTKERFSLHSQPGNCLIPNEYKTWVSSSHCPWTSFQKKEVWGHEQSGDAVRSDTLWIMIPGQVMPLSPSSRSLNSAVTKLVSSNTWKSHTRWTLLMMEESHADRSSYMVSV